MITVLTLFLFTSDLTDGVNDCAAKMPIRYMTVGDPSRRIAVARDDRSSEIGVMFLPGFHSKMTSNKGNSISDWARTRNCSCTLFDYSGHGASEGNIQEGTISRWLEESMHVFSEQTKGKQILVGSSMGGYLALLLWKHQLKKSAQEATRIHALILIAPAWDLTEKLLWNNFSPQIQKQIWSSGVYYRPSAYGDGPYPITRQFIEDGQKHMLFADGWQFPKPSPPIRIVHGVRDEDVPHTHSSQLIDLLDNMNTKLQLVEDGDHRLSRPQDLVLLCAILDAALSSDPADTRTKDDEPVI
jgi:pimeloyl-ACP methyl ester carboxylesterase